MRIIKAILAIILISTLSCKSNNNSKREENRELQFLYYANGGLIGYYDDGTIVGCPRCDLMDENINLMKSREPHSRFKIVDKVLISEQGDSVPIHSMKSNEWAIINYKTNFKEKKKP